MDGARSSVAVAEGNLTPFEQRIHRSFQRVETHVGDLDGFLGPRHLMFRDAVNKNCHHSQPTTELHVRQRVAYYGAGGGTDLGKLATRLFKHAGKGLAAVAFQPVVRAVIECVDVGAVRHEQPLKGRMNGLNIRRGKPSQGDAALIRNDNHTQGGAIQFGNRFRHAGQHVKVRPPCNPLSFRHFFVQHAIAIEKDGAKIARQRTVCGVGHTIMITTMRTWVGVEEL